MLKKQRKWESESSSTTFPKSDILAANDLRWPQTSCKQQKQTGTANTPERKGLHNHGEMLDYRVLATVLRLTCFERNHGHPTVPLRRAPPAAPRPALSWPAVQGKSFSEQQHVTGGGSIEREAQLLARTTPWKLSSLNQRLSRRSEPVAAPLQWNAQALQQRTVGAAAAEMWLFKLRSHALALTRDYLTFGERKEPQWGAKGSPQETCVRGCGQSTLHVCFTEDFHSVPIAVNGATTESCCEYFWK